jgi:hypothetical protein
MPDAATIANRGTLGPFQPNTVTDTVIITGGTIFYGIGFHTTVAGGNAAHSHGVRVTDNNGNVLLISSIKSRLDDASAVFGVPMLVEGVNVTVVSHVTSVTPVVEYVVWTDGSHVRATEQQ